MSIQHSSGGENGSNQFALSKRKSVDCINLTIHGLADILIETHGYTAEYEKNKKKPVKTLKYFPMSKIYDECGNLIFDSSTVALNLTGQQRTREIQRITMNTLIKELEKKSYTFKLSRNRGGKYKRIEGYYDPIEDNSFTRKQLMFVHGVKLYQKLNEWFSEKNQSVQVDQQKINCPSSFSDDEKDQVSKSQSDQSLNEEQEQEEYIYEEIEFSEGSDGDSPDGFIQQNSNINPKFK